MKNIFLILLALMLVSCAAKKPKVSSSYNQSAQKWYSLIIKDLMNNDLEKADADYISMSSEHIADPLLEPTLMILAFAHMDNEEYLMADFYLDEYLKKFGSVKNTEYISYLKLRAKFSSFKSPNRNEALMHASIKEINNYLSNFPNSAYKELVETMLVKFELALYFLNQNIANLYQKTGKELSFKIYEKKIKDSVFYGLSISQPSPVWYRKLFE